ncbi:hypothetical protein ABZN20_08020 [Methylococcus sp. ANG]|uniref:hypothetical protein n=1 Tax=Methylococcus sp. ANG TaxID=3231903 RepID=UPI00345AC12D
MNPHPSTLAEPQISTDVLVGILRSLLMQYARTPSPSIAGNIANCLDRLLSHPQFDEPPQERCTYLYMRTYWRLVESLG